MRNKRLIVLLSVLGGVAAVIIIMSAIFTVYSTDAECQTFYGEDTVTYQTIQRVNEEIRKIADDFRYRNIFLFNEQEVLDRVNAEVPEADAYDVECIFPNKIVVKYYLVTETMQFKVGDQYVVTGENGKVMRVNDYDSTSLDGGHYNETLISVIPSAGTALHATVGTGVFADDTCFEKTALDIIVGMADDMIETDTGNRAFGKSNYAEIDLSDRRNVILRMRSNANEPYGITFELGDGTDMLADKVLALATLFVRQPEINFYGKTGTVYKSYSDSLGKYIIRISVS